MLVVGAIAFEVLTNLISDAASSFLTGNSQPGSSVIAAILPQDSKENPALRGTDRAPDPGTTPGDRGETPSAPADPAPQDYAVTVGMPD